MTPGGRVRGGAAADYTRGNIARGMITFAVPHMLSSALQIMYSAVDLGIVGKAVSGAALSAVSVSGNVLNLLTMLGLGFATGGQVYMSQLLGMGKREAVGRAAGTLLTAVTALGLLLAAASALLCPRIFRLMSVPAEAYEMAVVYMRVCCAGLVFSFIYNALAAALRAHGDSAAPLRAILISSLVNLVLDIWFVVSLGWGVAGAAAATAIGQGVSALILLAAIMKKGWTGLTAASLRPEWGIFRAVTSLAIPYALEMAVFNVSMLFVNRMVNTVGLYASETFGIGLKVEEIGNRLCTGITCAASVMTGQNMAAGNTERTRRVVRTAFAFGALMYAAFAAVCFTGSRFLFSLFVDDREVIEMAPMFISCIAWGFPAMASMRGTNGLMQGVGSAKLSFAIGIIDGLLVRIPLSYLLGVTFGMGLRGFFLAYALAAYVNAGLGMAYYLSGRWKTKKLAAQA